jgi:hypothetical protein
MQIVSAANHPTSLVFSQEQFVATQTDDFFLTDVKQTPTVTITHFPEHNVIAQKWVRFSVQQHSAWITPNLHTKCLANDAGIPITECDFPIMCASTSFRCISANQAQTARYAAHLILTIEKCLRQKTLTTILTRYFDVATLNTHSESDIQEIRSTLMQACHIDTLLHYLNWNPCAFEILMHIFELYEHSDNISRIQAHSWADIAQLRRADATTNFLLVMENNTVTVLYFSLPNYVRKSRSRRPTLNAAPADENVEHSLASVKLFHRNPGCVTKLSTFHRDKAKPTTHTDVAYLLTITNTINRIRDTYLTSVSRSTHKRDLATITKLIEEVVHIKNSLNKNQLSRHQYNSIRVYLLETSLQLRQLINKITTKLTSKQQQQSLIIPFLQRAMQTPLIESDSTEDYRGESD